MWDVEKPISNLEQNIQEEFLQHAKTLHNDLLFNKLTVVLIPAPEQKHYEHKIRIAINKNPQWYSNLFNTYAEFRRDLSQKALERIIKKEDKEFNGFHYRYDSLYRDVIKTHLTKGYYSEQGFIPANNEIKKYFEKK